nr:histone-lysine N-methyltransferase SETD1A-like [Ipomoea batatas]
MRDSPPVHQRRRQVKKQQALDKKQVVEKIAKSGLSAQTKPKKTLLRIAHAADISVCINPRAIRLTLDAAIDDYRNEEDEDDEEELVCKKREEQDAINCANESYKHKRPPPNRSLGNAAVKISAEEYEYEIVRSLEEYSKAKLDPPRYDLPAKYTPQRAVVTVAAAPPPLDASSQGPYHEELPSVRPPAKISLGSKKTEPSRPADPSAEASIPTGLPLAATHPTGLSGDQETDRAAKRGKEKEVLEIEEVTTAKRSRRDGTGSTTPVIDVLMRHGDEPPAALLARICAAAPPPEKTSGWSTALVGERIARDLIQLLLNETGEAVLAAISRTPVGEDLMYEFGTWAFNKGWRAMQSDVRAALEVSIDDGDLQRVLAVLLDEVPDPGPTPFSTTPEGEVLPVPLAEAPAGQTAEDTATPKAGQTAEGAIGPDVEPSGDRP